MDKSYTSSNLEYNLLMQNIQVLESSLAGKDLVRLERDILVHIERLGALKSFNASISRATLTQTYESEFSLPGDIIKLDPEIPLEEQNVVVIVRSGKSQERKLKRMKASEKGSRVSVKTPSRKSKKSSSSQFIAEWKNYPGRRRSIVREQSALLVTIKVLFIISIFIPFSSQLLLTITYPSWFYSYCSLGVCKPWENKRKLVEGWEWSQPCKLGQGSWNWWSIVEE